MTGHPAPSWERLAFWLVATVISLEVAAQVLPRLVVPVVVFTAAFCVVRLILFHTRDGW
jgi:hypothetical protein